MDIKRLDIGHMTGRFISQLVIGHWIYHNMRPLFQTPGEERKLIGYGDWTLWFAHWIWELSDWTQTIIRPWAGTKYWACLMFQSQKQENTLEYCNNNTRLSKKHLKKVLYGPLRCFGQCFHVFTLVASKLSFETFRHENFLHRSTLLFASYVLIIPNFLKYSKKI